MKVLSYNPADDLFFIGVTWAEYRRLAEMYKIDANGSSVEEVIELCKRFLEETEEEETEGFSYRQYIRDLYGIDDIPNMCLIVERDLSFLAFQQYDYPFGHMWNAYSPWKRIEPVSISDLYDLATLVCIEKRQNDV